MTKSFIDEVPREVEQAAEILGASRWRVALRGGLASDLLGAGGHIHVHPDPQLERVPVGADPVQARMW